MNQSARLYGRSASRKGCPGLADEDQGGRGSWAEKQMKSDQHLWKVLHRHRLYLPSHIGRRQSLWMLERSAESEATSTSSLPSSSRRPLALSTDAITQLFLSTMRIRISILPPLSSLKAWFLIPSSCSTIADLKSLLLKDLPLALQSVRRAEDLRLEVDGFELLGGSGCEVLDGERDVVW
jgi:hypothetical protein